MKISTIVACALSFAIAGESGATTVVLNETVDTSTFSGGPSFFGGEGFKTSGPFSPNFAPYSLAIGDTLDFTAKFLPGQTVTLNGPIFFWLFSLAQSGNMTVDGTGTLTLLDTSGNPLFTSNSLSDTECCAHFGQSFSASDFASLPSLVTFAGLHYVGTVNGYGNPSTTSRDYATPGVFFGARGSSPTPEPAAWMLMTGGLFAAGGALRRRATAPRVNLHIPQLP